MTTATKLGKDEIVSAISNLTVLELSELVKAIEDKFGVKAAAVGAVMAAAPPRAEPLPPPPERTRPISPSS